MCGKKRAKQTELQWVLIAEDIPAPLLSLLTLTTTVQLKNQPDRLRQVHQWSWSIIVDSSHRFERVRHLSRKYYHVFIRIELRQCQQLIIWLVWCLVFVFAPIHHRWGRLNELAGRWSCPLSRSEWSDSFCLDCDLCSGPLIGHKCWSAASWKASLPSTHDSPWHWNAVWMTVFLFDLKLNRAQVAVKLSRCQQM